VLFDDSPPSSLTGIARLAARSPVLEAKSRVRYFEIETRSVLNRTRPGMPFRWTINPYRGCEFACKYCYARYTHEFMGIEDATLFEDQIYAKSNLAPILRQELRKLDPAEAIAIGTATDPYQPAERRFRRTRSILEVFAAEHGRRLSITTKSDLVTRDLDLLLRIAESNVLSINITITTLDRELARMLEPRAPRPDLRLRAVRILAGAGLRVGVFPNPILPLITDSERRLDQLARAARDHGASYFGGGLLFLMPAARRVFFPFLAERFPELLARYERRYTRNAYLRGEYADMLRDRVRAIRARYRLDNGPLEHMPAGMEPEQPSLFEIQPASSPRYPGA
jgi:DNA repair photolyase